LWLFGQGLEIDPVATAPGSEFVVAKEHDYHAEKQFNEKDCIDSALTLKPCSSFVVILPGAALGIDR